VRREQWTRQRDNGYQELQAQCAEDRAHECPRPSTFGVPSLLPDPTRWSKAATCTILPPQIHSSNENCTKILLSQNYRGVTLIRQMTGVTRWLNDTVENRWVVFSGTVASLASFFMAFRLGFQNVFANATLACTLTLFVATAIYSIRVREKLMALQNAARLVHDINHEYRDVLSEALGPHENLQQTGPIDPELVKREREVIETVCNRIAAIYTALISRPCTVTVKILTKEGSDWFCHTYARSEPRSRRDRDGGPDTYAVGSGENTAFDIASQPAPEGISHFFSPDLPKLKRATDIATVGTISKNITRVRLLFRFDSTPKPSKRESPTTADSFASIRPQHTV
jgi:hypothetical protein